jgi:hypothetical protein
MEDFSCVTWDYYEIFVFVTHCPDICHHVVRDGQILMLDISASIFISALQLQEAYYTSYL